MYRIYDKKAAIREVQKYLLLISDRSDYKIPRVSIDGIYGPETAAAVSKFQEVFGYEISGRVDMKTFDSLYSVYLSTLIEENITENQIERNIFPLKAGMMGDTVANLNILLSGLRETYIDIAPVRKNAYFSVETENAVSDMQKIFNKQTTGIVDALLYERLSNELKALRNKEKK